jgi:hypothetical protein
MPPYIGLMMFLRAGATVKWLCISHENSTFINKLVDVAMWGNLDEAK